MTLQLKKENEKRWTIQTGVYCIHQRFGMYHIMVFTTPKRKTWEWFLTVQPLTKVFPSTQSCYRDLTISLLGVILRFHKEPIRLMSGSSGQTEQSFWQWGLVFPLVTETVHNFYVDDCVKSVPDETETIQLTSLHWAAKEGFRSRVG